MKEINHIKGVYSSHAFQESHKLTKFLCLGYKYGFHEKRVLFCLCFLLFVSQLKHLPALTYSYRFHMKSQKYEQFYQSLK